MTVCKHCMTQRKHAVDTACAPQSPAPNHVACAAGVAGNQAGAARIISNSHTVPKVPLSLPTGVNTAAAQTAAKQPASTSTGGPAHMPPPSMPRRTALKQPPTSTPPAAVAGAPPAATSVATAAAAGTAGSKASSQDKRQQNAKAYLARLQEGLPATAYQQLMKHLQRYRKDHDTLQVTDGVLDVLRLPSRRHLLLDFAAFLRTQDRDWFLRCVK